MKDALTSDVKFRALPVAAVGGTLIVAVVYLLTNIAYFAVLGVQGTLESDAVVVVR